jgi:hypothetical protein
MSGGGASLDLRYPIGGLFSALGVLLAAFGASTAGDTAMYAKSEGMNINLIWGIVLLVTGLLFLLLARNGARADAARH